MDGEFLNEQPSNQLNNFSHSDIFKKHFPYYLSIGMTEEQYWDKDCVLVTYYREAEEIRKERINQEAWLQGMYIYDTLCRVSPLFQAFAKKGTKPPSYIDEPYPISKEKAKEIQNQKDKAITQKGQMYMHAYMMGNNKKYEERNGINVNND